MIAPAEALLVICAFLTAGVVKGIIGMGLPTTAIAIMTLAIDPRQAIGLILIPMVITNGWQVYRSGGILAALRRYLPMELTLIAGVAITVVLSRNAPDHLLFGSLGIAVLCFVAVNIIGRPPAIPVRHDRTAQVLTGVVAGVLGGFTSVWAPPMAIYLAARQVPKDEFVRASGLLIFLGSLPLTAGYALQGNLPLPAAGLSLVLLVPALLGFSAGERLRHNLSETRFRKVMLAAFLLMGLNLLRRAFV